MTMSQQSWNHGENEGVRMCKGDFTSEYRVEPLDDLGWGEGPGSWWGGGDWTPLPSFNLIVKCRNGQATNHFTRRFC